jgi:adenylate cyclase
MARDLVPKSLKKYVPAAIAAVFTVAFLVLGFFRLNLDGLDPLTRIEFLWLDYKFRIRGAQPPGGNEVVLVALDGKTLERFGSGRVFQRDVLANLVDTVAAGKPKVIGFDITYEDPDPTNPENDKKFAAAIRRAGNVILGVQLVLESNAGDRRASTPMTKEFEDIIVAKQVFPAEYRSGNESGRVSEVIRAKALALNRPELTKAAASFGFVNFHKDPEGGLRFQPQFIEYQGQLYPSLDIQLLKAYLDAPSPTVEIQGEHITHVQVGQYTLETDQYGRYMLDFDGPRGLHKTVSMVDVLDGKVSPAQFQDKILIIGSAEVGLGDVVVSPFDSTMPGMELHANVLENFIHGNFLHRTIATRFVDLALILFFGLIIAIFLPSLPATRSVGLAVFLFLLFTGLNIFAFLKLHWVLSFVYPGLSLVMTSGILISYKYLTEEREKKRTRQTFQYYLDQHVIEQVLRNQELLKLGGEKREMSVLFSDIRGFTSFSEKMAPNEVVHFLNQYFDRMTGLIFQYKGTLDKLIGDAVMCFWGHPIETKDHAVRAVLCALEMTWGVDDLRSVLVLPGGAKFEIGIGVNTGQMVVGNMGSQNRFSYTVMGDNVNLGSRLESLNKYYGTHILISDTTYEECKHLIFCRELDTIQVKGKSQAVTIYEPLGMRRLTDDRRTQADRRSHLTTAKKIKRAYITALHGERRRGNRRLGSARLVVRPEQEEIASMYEHALALYRKGDFDGAEIGLDHVLSLSPNDGPSKLMKGRIAKYRMEYAGAGSAFDPVYKFDEK